MVMLVLWMIAAGVIVVVMRVVVAMIVVAVGMMVVVMPMIMVVIVIVIVIMAVMVGLRRVALGLRIGPAFGIERRLERDHAGAETLDHRLDHGIAADAERLWQDFGR
jgi:hypothetical protein